jgi:hypothetical protein
MDEWYNDVLNIILQHITRTPHTHMKRENKAPLKNDDAIHAQSTIYSRSKYKLRRIKQVCWE